MADKRMFSKSIVLSDAFLDMPMSARCLYFTLSMFGDDDGFVNSPKAIMRQCGSSEDDLKVLCAKKFILPFESGVIVIKHWRINNYLRSDRYRPTKYVEEKEMLKTEENGAYTLRSQEEILLAHQESEKRVELTCTQVVERAFGPELKKIVSTYEKNRSYLFDKGMLKTETVTINEASVFTLLEDRIREVGFDTVQAVIENSINDDFCIKSDYILNIILSQNVFNILLQGIDSKSNHPRVCPKCNKGLVDNSGGAGMSWYCTECGCEYRYEKGKWILG